MSGFRKRPIAAPIPCMHMVVQLSVSDGIGEAGHVRLNDEDVAYLMNLLRNATQPVTTQQLIDALRRQSGQAYGNPGEPDAAAES